MGAVELWMQAVKELHLFSVNFQATAAAATATAIVVNMKNDYNNAIMNSTYSAHAQPPRPPKRTERQTGTRVCEIIEGDNLSSLNKRQCRNFDIAIYKCTFKIITCVSYLKQGTARFRAARAHTKRCTFGGTRTCEFNTLLVCGNQYLGVVVLRPIVCYSVQFSVSCCRFLISFQSF